MATESGQQDLSAAANGTPPAIPPSRPAGLAPAVAAGTVFVASGAVLMLEILAVRLLAPYVGLTLETTTSIIGAVLAGIAIGAAVGGWFADRCDPRRLLVGLLIGGGLLALLTVPIVRWLGPGARGHGDLAALGITVASLVPSAAVLSAVSPTVARLQLHDLRTSGTIVGRLSAFATAGALVGTFGTGFVVVPRMPVSTAVLGIGLALVAAGLVLGFSLRALHRAAAVGVVGATIALAALAATRDSPCDAETRYHCAVIVAAGPTGRELYLDTEGNSHVDLADPTHLEYFYARWIAKVIDATWPAGRPRRMVVIGGGGGTLPRWLLATRPGSHAEVLEVDKELVELDQQRLGLKLSPALQVKVGDARTTLQELPTASADIVVGDAFSGLTVPWHLLTREALKTPADVLDVLASLRSRGYRLGLVSVCGPATVEVWPDTSLVTVIHHHNLSAATGLVKPDAAAYLSVCAAARVSPGQALFIGDGAGDELRGAAAAGLTPILLESEASSEAGFGPESWSGLRINSLAQLLAAD